MTRVWCTLRGATCRPRQAASSSALSRLWWPSSCSRRTTAATVETPWALFRTLAWRWKGPPSRPCRRGRASALRPHSTSPHRAAQPPTSFARDRSLNLSRSCRRLWLCLGSCASCVWPSFSSSVVSLERRRPIPSGAARSLPRSTSPTAKRQRDNWCKTTTVHTMPSATRRSKPHHLSSPRTLTQSRHLSPWTPLLQPRSRGVRWRPRSRSTTTTR
mmetsp:Transcript_34587/g.74767  ORF Transcript_34587/g.74767 Transcript_34587/m.74767 type:complete len:216 (-) Transcript_34587:63-710(-)